MQDIILTFLWQLLNILFTQLIAFRLLKLTKSKKYFTGIFALITAILFSLNSALMYSNQHNEKVIIEHGLLYTLEADFVTTDDDCDIENLDFRQFSFGVNWGTLGTIGVSNDTVALIGIKHLNLLSVQIFSYEQWLYIERTKVEENCIEKLLPKKIENQEIIHQ